MAEKKILRSNSSLDDLNAFSSNCQSIDKAICPPDWVALPDEITKKIFLMMGQISILQTAQFICKSWYILCKDPALWKNIEFDPFQRGLIINPKCYDAMRLHAVNLSCGGLEGISFELGPSLSHVLHITTMMCGSLKRLRFVGCRFKAYTLEQIFKTLPLLEVVEIRSCYFPLGEVIRALGRACPLLHTLRHTLEIRCPYGKRRKEAIENHEAFAIAEYLPQLRHLSIHNYYHLSNQGLQAILDNCSLLETLDLHSCDNLILEEGSSLLMRCQALKQFKCLTPAPLIA